MHPVTPYGIAKNALKGLTKTTAASEGLQWQWLRGYYIVGNSLSGQSVFSKLMAANQRGDHRFPLNSGNNLYDFLDYDEFCIRVVAAVRQSDVGGIIEICSGLPIRLSERVERFISENGLTIKPAYGEYPDRPYDSKGIWGDDGKIKAILEKASYN